MASNVNTAFAEFLKNTVNLDANETNTARNSRDWLVGKIHGFGGKDMFPVLYNEKDIFFGSFARKTKIRELDDIDIMICLSALGSTYNPYQAGSIEITVPESAEALYCLCHDYTDKLNSRKVINKVISKLSSVPQYKKAEISRNQEAAILNLQTYTWSFDIIPCFFTSPDQYCRTYYLIPDGSGNWQKTDPRIDSDHVSSLNQKHNGYALNLIRIVKYWNRRPTMPSMQSYLLECMLLNHLEGSTQCSDYIDIAFRDALAYIYSAIYNSVQDPKGIQGDLNNLPTEERKKISDRAAMDYNKAIDAGTYEGKGDHKSAINKWREIFGDQFPPYT